MRQVILFIILILATACSKPVANFMYVAPTSIPSKIHVENTSSGAESFRWYLNGIKVSDSLHLDLHLVESGRHQILLEAQKGSQTDLKLTEFIVTPPDNCLVYMLTSEGELIFELSEKTIGHQNHFTTLVEDKYFEDISFHRVIDDFMIQAGDPATRTQKSGREYAELDAEIDQTLIHVRGAVAAARMPDNINPEKRSSGTQFYIVDGRRLSQSSIESAESEKLFYYTEKQKEAYLENGGAPQLDGEYTVFGMLIEGFDTLDKIAQTETDRNNRPLNEIKILEVKLIN